MVTIWNDEEEQVDPDLLEDEVDDAALDPDLLDEEDEMPDVDEDDEE